MQRIMEEINYKCPRAAKLERERKETSSKHYVSRFQKSTNRAKGTAITEDAAAGMSELS